MTALESFLSAEDRAAIRAPIAAARTFPREAYTSESFHRLELEKIFQRRWVALCFADQLPDPGDAAPFRELGISLVAVRGTDGELRVFHNICSYDGCELVMAPIRGAEHLRVSYHGWRYDLTGKLIATPFWDGSAEGDIEAIAADKRDLVQVASGIHAGVVFVDISGTDGPFDDFTAPLRELSPHYDLETLQISRDDKGDPWILEDGAAGAIGANWKTIVENDCINLLHEAHTHELYRNSPDVPRVDENRNPKFVWHNDGALLGFEYKESDVPNTYPVPASIPHVGADPNVRPTSGYFLQLYPNLSVVLHPQFTMLNILLPIGSARAAFLSTFRTNQAVAGSDSFEQIEAVAGMLEGALAEDTAVVESVQRARQSPLAGRHFYAPFWDFGHYRFNQLVLDDLET